MKLDPMVCMEDDYIVRHGTIGLEMYFLTMGTVQVLDDSNQIVARMEAVSFFG